MGTSMNRGKWSQPGVPHKGWMCVDIVDLDEPAAVCEMCEQRGIRYVHTMQHPEFDEELGVGCVCAGHMEDDYEAPRQRERRLQRVAGRRSRWLGRKWRVSRKGNAYLNVDGMNIVIYRTHGGLWRARITDDVSECSRITRLRPSEDAAKLAAFDSMIFLRESGWGHQ